MSKRLMPTYLVEFLEEVYPFTRPANFGSRMVTRQFIAETKALYEFVNKEPISNYSRRLVPEYLIKFLEEADYVEFEYESTDYTYEIGATVLKFAEINYIGGMSYVVDNAMQNSPVTSVVSKDADGNTIDTFNIPAEIQANEYYGLGYDENSYNKLDLITKNIYADYKLFVFNGSEDWTDRPDFADCDRFVLNSGSYGIKVGGKGLCNRFNYTTTVTSNVGVIINNNASQIVVNFSTKGTTTLAEFKTWLSNNNISLLIEMDTTQTIDVSQYLGDSFIKVASGGSLTFTNTHEQDVPTSVTYLVEV